MRHRAQGGDDLPDRVPDLRVALVRLARGAALDEDALTVGLLDDGEVEHAFGPPRLSWVVAVELVGAEPLPDHYRRDDQQQPAEHGGLAVPGGPSGHSFDDGSA